MHLGRSWRDLGSFLDVWEASWQRLRSHLGVFGESRFGYVWTVLGPKKHVKDEKVLVKRPSHLDFNFGKIFDRFWIVFFVLRERNSIEKIMGFQYQRAFRLF